MSSVPTLAGYYAFVLWSPIVSIFNYNSVWLGLFVAWWLVKRQATDRSVLYHGLPRLWSGKRREALDLPQQKESMSRIDSNSRHRPR